MTCKDTDTETPKPEILDQQAKPLAIKSNFPWLHCDVWAQLRFPCLHVLFSQPSCGVV